MTGLDVEHDVIVEIACIVTDSNLVALDDGIQLVVHAGRRRRSHGWTTSCATMHTKSGLLARDREPRPSDTRQGGEGRARRTCRQHVPSAARRRRCAATASAWTAGSSARYMPELDNYLHYRSVDVSSFKELCRRWYPAIYRKRPGKAEAHRALDDIRESIEELRYYREQLLSPLGRSRALRHLEPDADTAPGNSAEQSA